MINCLQIFFLFSKFSEYTCKINFSECNFGMEGALDGSCTPCNRGYTKGTFGFGNCNKCGYMRSTAEEGTVDELLCRKLKQKIFY